MTMWRISPKEQLLFAAKPEVAMDTQIGIIGGKEVAIIGCRLAIAFDQKLENDLMHRREIMGINTFKMQAEEYEFNLLQWFNSLDIAPVISLVEDREEARIIMGMIRHGSRPGAVTSTPARPTHIYGHLPHQARCDGSDVFYRYEAFPTSLRIDQVNQKVTKPDTYAAPFSEKDFTPTGLSAVGRFALPSLDPHRWRWELQPVAHTLVYYGASVPLYGQAGGAVEVMLPDPFDNLVPIPNPTVLDIL